METVTTPNVALLYEALVEAQAELKNPKKSEEAKVKSKKTGVEFSYQYTALDEILDQVRPVLQKYGLGIMHLMENTDGRHVLVCRLYHKSGAFIESFFRLPEDVGGPQDLGSWMSYMRRYSVTAILALAGEPDDDAKAAQDAAEDAKAARRQEAREKMAAESRSRHPDPQPTGKLTSAYDGRTLKPGENPLPPEKTEPKEPQAKAKPKAAAAVAIDARLGALCKKAGIAPEQLKAYAVSKGHIPPETDMTKLPESFVAAYIKNWKKIEDAVSN